MVARSAQVAPPIGQLPFEIAKIQYSPRHLFLSLEWWEGRLGCCNEVDHVNHAEQWLRFLPEKVC